MTERGLPTSVDSAPACPFVAFEDDRETRATSPDDRHRCYAELVPSARAAAHQEAYCLSSAFPVCPTFQDWARREAAHARGEGDRPRAALTAQPESAGHPEDEQAPPTDRVVKDERPRRGPVDDLPIRRNPPRDWAAPPPWAPGGAAPGSGSGATRRSPSGEPMDTPGFLAGRADESRGLAGSAADRLVTGAAGAGQPGDVGAPGAFDPAASAGADEELAGLVSERPIIARPPPDYPPSSRSTRRPSVSSTRPSHREHELERDVVVGPSWERARRFEAYPTIRTRAGLPSLPRLVVLTVALGIAALALFFLPALLGVGGGDKNTSTPSPSASHSVATASLEPTTPPGPTPQVYVVASGDTLSKIAAKFGFKTDELCAANKDTITDCDKIAVGAEIIIPVKPPDEFVEPSAGPS